MNRKIKIRINYTHHPCGRPLKHETILFLPIKKKEKKKKKLFYGLFCNTYLPCGLLYEAFLLILMKLMILPVPTTPIGK